MSHFQKRVDEIVKKELQKLEDVLIRVKPQTFVDKIVQNVKQEKVNK